MKKFILLTIGLLAPLLSTQAQSYFTNGNLAVLRLSGNDSSSGDGAAIYIDQYMTNGGAAVTSFSVPTNGANSVILAGVTYEGFLTLTPDNSHLVVAGYNTSLPASSELVDTTSASVPRAIATLDAYGNFAVPIKNTTIFSGYDVIGGASDGTNYWMTGNGPSGEFTTGLYPQVVYLGTASSGTAAQVGTNAFTSGVRSLNVYKVNGSYGLYGCGYSATNYGYNTTIYGSGGFLFSNISGSLPTSATGSTNLFPDGTSSVGTGCDIAINPAGTIAYLADLSLGVIKYTNSGSGWISNYTIVPTNAGYVSSSGKEAISVTADWSQSPPVVYATTAETYTNRLVRFSDTNGATPAIINLAFGSITTGVVTNTLRGVRFVPVASPQISAEPVSFVGNPGQTATFTATALGVPAPTYQWYSNSVANPTYQAIPGATSATLSLANITTSQSGSQFYVVAVNTYGSAQSTPVTLTVNNPAITTEPVGATNLVGSPSVTLSVAAVGTGSLSYQWLANGVPISGAHGSSYTVPSSTVSNSIAYSVIVSNTVGAVSTSITSSPATVYYSEYLLYDTFSYPNGNLFGDPGSPWVEGNSSLSSPCIVTNGRVQLSEANGSDAQSLFIVSNVQNTVIWSSFIINLSSLPTNAGGVYFANLEDTNYGFYPAIFALTTNAYPGTYRLGISTTNVDSTGTKGGPDPTGIVPVDLAPGVDYQVVYAYDMVNVVAYLAINPSVTSDVNTSTFENDPNTAYTTTYALPPNGLSAAGLRQRAGEGVMQLDNLEVSLDTTVGAANICGYCAVTAGITPQAPVVGFPPVGFTNYIGGSNMMEVAASAIGSGITPTYAWYKNTAGSPATYTQISDGGDVTGSSTAAITFSDLTAADSGTYYVVVSNSVSGTQSASTVVDVITTPTAPFFVSPTNASTNSIGVDSSITFTALAEGSGPISYEWYFNNGVQNVAQGSGPSLTLTSLATNQSGTYTVVATGTTSPTATSSNFVLIVNPPVVTNIGYLISLMNTAAAPNPTLATSNTTTEYTVTGTVIVATNLTTSASASYYIEDSTGGIDFFVADPTFRPAMGDVVTVTGVLDLYYDTLELEASVANASETYIIVSTNGEPGTNTTYPVTPHLLPLGYPQAQPALTTINDECSFVIITNVYFEGAGGTFLSETDVTVTNQAGVSYGVTVYPGEEPGSPLTSIIGQTIPRFAYSVAGALNEYSSTDWELNVTRYSDIVTTPPPPVTNLTATVSGVNNTNITLAWTAVADRYTYTVLSSTNVTGPYAPLMPGLLFSNAAGKFTDVGPGATTKFYRIVSP